MIQNVPHSNHVELTDVLASPPSRMIPSLVKAALATALFRCWHILLFFAAWSTTITVLNARLPHHPLVIQPTLLTVFGTVLGFVISYRTTSSFERYNEGRRYWSQIILASRTLARTVWFHVPELVPPTKEDTDLGRSEEERKARVLVEKKTIINLIEAFSVAVKHYLRGEEGINYIDLYHLVKFLPSYAFPVGMIPPEPRQSEDSNLRRTKSRSTEKKSTESDEKEGPNFTFTVPTATQSLAELSNLPSLPTEDTTQGNGSSGPHVKLELPLPVTSKEERKSDGHDNRTPVYPMASARVSTTGLSLRSRPSNVSRASRTPNKTSYGFTDTEPVVLLPASMPPKYTLFDFFPFSLLIKTLAKKGRGVEGKKAAKLKAKQGIVTRNVPLEISMYLTSYVATLAARKSIDAPTTTMMANTVNLLADALTGLERILTTPIPFSYSIHLWLVTLIYCMALPFQLFTALDWVTIPATVIASFIFFGFLVAGEEIENPFGYDKNDLNIDHFVHNIIRNELIALTAFPPPDPAQWAFSPRNNCLFVDSSLIDEVGEPVESITPEQWVQRGSGAMKNVLASY